MGKVKTILKAAGVTMGVMYVMDKAQNANATVFKFTGPRQTVIQKFMDFLIFWN